MLTFSTLATRVSWTTDFCKGELKKWNKAQQKMKHMLVLQWNLWARCRKNLLEISNTKSYHQQRIIIATIYYYIIIIIIIITILLLQRIHKIFPYKFYEGEQGTTIKRIVSKLLM